MLAMAVQSGSAPPGGQVRLRLMDRTEHGTQEVMISVNVDKARAHLKKRGFMR